VKRSHAVTLHYSDTISIIIKSHYNKNCNLVSDMLRGMTQTGPGEQSIADGYLI